MTHCFNLNPQPFDSIKNGSKTVEMRLFDEKRQKISIGDTINFVNNVTSEQMEVVVKGLQVFDNFEQLYMHFDKVSLGYDAGEVAIPQDMYHFYTQQQVDQYGVVAIIVQLV